MQELLTWRNLRNKLDDMLKARDMNYREAVELYYKEHPKDLSEKRLKVAQDITSNLKKKKFADEDSFYFENSPEKKYWKKRPKDDSDLSKDKLPEKDESRYSKAIVFFEKLIQFIRLLDCPKSGQWIIEHEGIDFWNEFQREVIQPLKREIEDKKYKEGMSDLDF